MTSKENKSQKVRSKKEKSPKSLIKKNGRKRKEFILPITFIVLGLSLIPSGIMLSMGSQTISNDNIIRTQFSQILINVKVDLELEFHDLLEEMEKDPLNGLFMDKMPTPEEIFFAEWANDWFPDIQIPLIGDHIESIGANMVGNINLDGELPEADLNISTHLNPSGISLYQCQVLWDPLNENSLTSADPSIWFSASEGSNEVRDFLKLNFNLTDNQINLVRNWTIISQSSWMRQYAQEEIFVLNPLLLIGLIGPGIALISYGVFNLRSEILKGRKKDLKNPKIKNKKTGVVNENK